ncbi:MAG: AEC family transporter [Clostridia bacterium]|nr:hypothetical protein [Oscillospiraceae bacterium]MBQ7033700.1 AEC family transporter [Clostridia bacterium]
MGIFIPTLSQMAFLFLLIAVGFLLVKTRVMGEGAAAVLAKLENTVLIPALVLRTFVENFTVERLGNSWTLFLSAFVLCFISMALAIGLSRLCTKDGYLRRIYTYGLTFSNFGFMGNAVVSALFPDIFFEYLIFTLPLWTMIYLWGVPALLLRDEGVQQTLARRLKAFVNPMFIAMILGMLIGLSGIKLPGFVSGAVSSAADCMSPVAMLLTGITVAATPMKKMLSVGSVYVVTAIRLLSMPLLFLALCCFVEFSDTFIVCATSALAMPLGLNTIVIPSAYGRDTSAAAGMTIVSHLCACGTIPLVFMLMQKVM